ncbi:unnamed protein product [Prunus armeniaca]|uniref:Uncharacterized protein n=1 Tax=Prunus armeniaca TaxID=36596 RepID=A0A6J5X683_PRUAR|nr:unnamed protein product [Prunus armeniaca]
MKKSMYFDDNLQDVEQFEMLCGCGSEYHFLHVHLRLHLRNWVYALKEDDELEGQDEEAFVNGDWKECEIRWEEEGD